MNTTIYQTIALCALFGLYAMTCTFLGAAITASSIIRAMRSVASGLDDLPESMRCAAGVILACAEGLSIRYERRLSLWAAACAFALTVGSVLLFIGR